MALGSDIQVFDQCVPYPPLKMKYRLLQIELINGQQECQKYHNRKSQTLFGIIQVD
jgi:queuine/archaeosine tRNA-ribosyltransferase